MSLSESAACHVKCEWGKKKDKSRLITIVTKRKTVSVSIHQENHSNTRLRPGVLSTSNSVTNTDLKGPNLSQMHIVMPRGIQILGQALALIKIFAR